MNVDNVLKFTCKKSKIDIKKRDKFLNKNNKNNYSTVIIVLRKLIINLLSIFLDRIINKIEKSFLIFDTIDLRFKKFNDYHFLKLIKNKKNSKISIDLKFNFIIFEFSNLKFILIKFIHIFYF